jgi:hypothetical protein
VIDYVCMLIRFHAVTMEAHTYEDGTSMPDTASPPPPPRFQSPGHMAFLLCTVGNLTYPNVSKEHEAFISKRW